MTPIPKKYLQIEKLKSLSYWTVINCAWCYALKEASLEVPVIRTEAVSLTSH